MQRLRSALIHLLCYGAALQPVASPARRLLTLVPSVAPTNVGRGPHPGLEGASAAGPIEMCQAPLDRHSTYEWEPAKSAKSHKAPHSMGFVGMVASSG